jgi:putative hydrolase of the HAD superfamily
VQVFVEHLDVALDSARFVDAFVAALVFRPAAGAVETLRRLRARRVRLGVAANWDCSLPATLAQLGIAELFDTVVTSAEAGAAKPDPAILHLALERLGARPDRALHVGDEALDEQAARAAGMRFVPAPLASAFEGWT